MKRLASFTALLGIFPSAKAGAPSSPERPKNLYELSARTIDGEEVSLARFKGKVLMIVNTASKCGYTPQYQGLQALHEKYSAQGFAVLGFPSNDFLWQEPGDNPAIKKFCEINYGVTFPLFEKSPVKGRKTQPVFRFLKGSPVGEKGGEIGWNFTKFLVGRDGEVAARYPTRADPLAPEITGKIEALLENRPAEPR